MMSGIGPCTFAGRIDGQALATSPDGYANQNNVIFTMPSLQQSCYFGMAIRPCDRGNNGNLLYIANSREGVTHLTLAVQTPRDLGVYRTNNSVYTNQIAYMPNVLRVNVWLYFEMYFLISNTVGELTCKINGETVYTGTNLDTRNGGYQDNFTHFTLSSPINYGDTRDECWLIDDLYTATSFLGPIHVERLYPDGAGATTDFTPLSGSNYQNVDEVFVDDDTSYNESADTPGNTDMFTCSNLANIDANVKCVDVETITRASAAGPVGVFSKVRSGTTEGDGTSKEIVGDVENYDITEHVFETDPDTTSAWTVSGVNSMQIGYEVA